jgi:hypothetical protein
VSREDDKYHDDDDDDDDDYEVEIDVKEYEVVYMNNY